MSRELVLLHICCGPCAVWPVDWLIEHGFDVEGFWFNPNIHPRREYAARLDSCRRYATAQTLLLHEQDEYGLRRFLAEVWPESADKPGRCARCYAMRLRATARKASEMGISVISTTLLVSPFQDHSLIIEAGQQAAREWGVRLLHPDWRPGFRAGRARSRQLKLYHQSYCGCVFSEDERYRPDVEKAGCQVNGCDVGGEA